MVDAYSHVYVSSNTMLVKVWTLAAKPLFLVSKKLLVEEKSVSDATEKFNFRHTKKELLPKNHYKIKPLKTQSYESIKIYFPFCFPCAKSNFNVPRCP